MSSEVKTPYRRGDRVAKWGSWIGGTVITNYNTWTACSVRWDIIRPGDRSTEYCFQNRLYTDNFDQYPYDKWSLAEAERGESKYYIVNPKTFEELCAEFDNRCPACKDA